MLFTALLKIESARIHEFSKEHEMALGAHISNWVFLWRIIWQNVDNKRNTLPTDWYVRYLTINNHLLSFKFLILIFFSPWNFHSRILFFRPVGDTLQWIFYYAFGGLIWGWPLVVNCHHDYNHCITSQSLYQLFSSLHVNSRLNCNTIKFSELGFGMLNCLEFPRAFQMNLSNACHIFRTRIAHNFIYKKY